MVSNLIHAVIASISSMRLAGQCLRRLRPLPGWLLCLALFAGLPGCGPAVSESTPSQWGSVNLGTSPESQARSQQIPTLPKAPPTPANNVAYSASNQMAMPAAREVAGPVPEYLTLPTWMAQGLNDSDVSVRLQALDAWVQQGAQAPLDPLIVALDDEDDAVSDKAMAIIEWQWEAWQEAKPQTVK